MKYVGYVVTFVVLVLFRGFALQQLWGWFMTPFGLPALSIAWALGVSQVSSMFIGSISDGEKSARNLFIKSFAVTLVSLVIGFVVHLFM